MLNLRTLRIERGKSQEQMASLLGKDRSVYARIEYGQVKLGAADALRLARALNASVQELLYPDGENIDQEDSR